MKLHKYKIDIGSSIYHTYLYHFQKKNMHFDRLMLITNILNYHAVYPCIF